MDFAKVFDYTCRFTFDKNRVVHVHDIGTGLHHGLSKTGYGDPVVSQPLYANFRTVCKDSRSIPAIKNENPFGFKVTPSRIKGGVQLLICGLVTQDVKECNNHWEAIW